MNAYETLLKKIGYQFKDSNLMMQALTHRSVGKNNNERLEFLGDSILSFVIASEVFHRFPDAQEGDLSRIRAYLVNGEKLSEIAVSLGLDQVLELGPGELKAGGSRRASIQEDAIEALLGAIYLDGGYGITRCVIVDLYKPHFETIPSHEELKDPKTRLQEYMQARKLPLPEYKIEQILGEQHKRRFKVSCTISGLIPPTFGVARSRREAEQISAQEALLQLKSN